MNFFHDTNGERKAYASYEKGAIENCNSLAQAA